MTDVWRELTALVASGLTEKEALTRATEALVTGVDCEGMKHPDAVVFASYGNDSIALIQWLREWQNGDTPFEKVLVVYSETGWSRPNWATRVAKGEAFARACGFLPAAIPSVGFVPLMRLKKAWPRHGMQFCTEHLKVKPALRFLDMVDPDGEAMCMVGVRRCESTRRAQWPELVDESEFHGGRELWSPLVRHDDEMRDALLVRAGFDVLRGRSEECWPCVGAGKAGIRAITQARVDEIAQLEQSMGVTSKGNPRTMYRPKKHGGAKGMAEVYKWAHSEHGKYRPPPAQGQEDEEEGQILLGACDAGWCGS